MSNKLSPRRTGKARSQVVRLAYRHEVKKPKKAQLLVREPMIIHERDNSAFPSGSGGSTYKKPVKLAEAHIDLAACRVSPPNPALRRFLSSNKHMVPIKVPQSKPRRFIYA